jgi:hypothetical protein
MYSWGSSYDDFKPSTKGRFRFTDARRAYGAAGAPADGDPRAYGPRPASAATVAFTFRDRDIVTESPYPLAVVIDTTGSMESWPRVFFEKLPLFYGEAQKYLEDCAISFQAVNDYYADGAAVCFQPAPFGQGPALDELLKQLCAFGRGGGQGTESYEVAAAWNSVRLRAPKALIKPVVLFLGDEAPFAELPPEVQETLGLPSSRTQDVFRTLHGAADVFLVRKPYCEKGCKLDRRIVEQWYELALMERERIFHLDDPRRVVDVLLGILAILSGKESHFEEEITTRQTPAQSRSVFRTLWRMLGLRTSIDTDDRGRKSIDPRRPSRATSTEDLST